MKNILLLILIASFSALNVMAQSHETGSNASTNFPANSIDNKDYSKIPIVKKIKECFMESYVYNFTVGKTRFRAVHIRVDSFPETVTIEKYQNKKWYKRLEFQSLNHYGCINFIDVNNDGFIDITMEARFTDDVYFYNPTINNFINSVCCEINDDIHLLDSTHHIYCDFETGKSMCGQIMSTLYTIKNFKKTALYQVELVNCDTAREYCDIKTLILSKCINGNEDELEELETIHLKKPLDEEKDNYFNNKAFWKKRYKKLLGYH